MSTYDKKNAPQLLQLILRLKTATDNDNEEEAKICITNIVKHAADMEDERAELLEHLLLAIKWIHEHGDGNGRLFVVRPLCIRWDLNVEKT